MRCTLPLNTELALYNPRTLEDVTITPLKFLTYTENWLVYKGQLCRKAFSDIDIIEDPDDPVPEVPVSEATRDEKKLYCIIREFMPEGIAFRNPGEPMQIINQSAYDARLDKVRETAWALSSIPEDISDLMPADYGFFWHSDSKTGHVTVYQLLSNDVATPYADHIAMETPDHLMHKTFPDLVQFFSQVTSQIKKLHKYSIVYGSASPENILCLANFSDHPKLSRTDTVTHMPLREAPYAAVSAKYGAPEQQAGLWENISMATDMYSIAAMLYARLYGQAPFGRDIRHLDTSYNLRSRFFQKMSYDTYAHLQYIFEKTLRTSPADRWQKSSTLCTSLKGLMDLATKDVQEKEPFALLMNAYCLHQRLGDDEAWAYLESAGWPDDKDIEEGWSGDSAIWSPSAIQQCLVSIKNKLFQKACWKELEWVCDVLRRLPKYNEWDMSGTEDAVTINENICTIITYQLQALQNQGLPIGKKLADQGDENDVKIALMVAEERFTQFNFADEATTKFLNAHINDITKDLNKHINAFPKNWENYKKLCELTSKLAQGLSYQCKYTDAKPLFTKAIAYARTNYDLITTNTYHLSAAARYANDDVDFLEVLKAWTEAIQKQLNAETPRKSVPQEKLGTPEYYTGMMKLLLDLKPHAVDYNLHYLLDVLLAALLRDCKPQETPWQECCQRICTMFNKAADNHTLSETDLKRHPYELIYKRLALLASYAGMETAGYIACLKESEEGESSIVKILRLANEYNLYARLQKSDKPSETTAMADCRERLCKLIQALPQDTVFDQDAYTAYCKAFAPYFDDSATVEQRTAILTYTYE